MSERKFTHVCSHCGKEPSFSILQYELVLANEWLDNKLYAMMKCDACYEIMLFIFQNKPPERKKDNGRIPMPWVSSPAGGSLYREKPTLEQEFSQARAGLIVVDFYPKRPYRSHEAVPKNIADDYGEALKCFDSGCYKATVAMCRRTMQAVCKDKKAPKLPLEKQIDAVVDGELRDYSHEIRHWGNIGGHPDEDIQEVEPDEAKTMLEFISLVFDRLYIYPYKLQQSKTKRGK